jgi:hypothetical protein
MLKPHTHTFKIKFHLIKLEAVNNKVSTRCHAYIRICISNHILENEDIYFKATPELKKNVAIFNSEIEYDNFPISFDELTATYDNKQVVMIL